MPDVIDFSELTFTDEQVRDLNELLYDAFVEAEAIAKFHTVVPGIETGKEVGYVGNFGLVGKAGQGCDPVSDNFALDVTKKLWAPVAWEVIRDFCFTELEGSLAIYAKKFGTDEPDLMNTAYAALIEDKLGLAIQEMLWRLVWFSDTAAANVSSSPAGTITDGVSVTYFNLLKGLWKQADEIVAADPNRLTTIAANSEATAALQDSALTADLAFGYLQEMIYKADPTLRQEGSRAIVMSTRSVVNKLEQYLMGKGIIPTYDNIIGGFNFESPGLKILGTTVFAIDIWDKIIRANYFDGSAYYRPHRMYYGLRENNLIGTPSNGMLTAVKHHYEPFRRLNRIEARDRIDTHFSIDKQTQWAF